jgi:2,3,4,5-tetrahydropyridine-2-carboxylate N-succinyltransferase
MDASQLQSDIETLLDDPSDLKGRRGRIVDDVMEALDEGRLRVASPDGNGGWTTHVWIKQAILLFIRRREPEWLGDPDGSAPVFYDKLRVKRDYDRIGVRCAAGGIARYGSYIARGCILMPGFVNVGAYVDEGSMVDTWATVGSCAQIGKNVHLAGGVGIGGVLEPPQASPVIVEDGAFIGSRCIVVEGVRVRAGAVLGAGTVLTASTRIVDVRGPQPVTTRGDVPERAVVIPGSIPKEFPAGTYNVPCALIVGTRSASTDVKSSLNDVLREYEIVV